MALIQEQLMCSKFHLFLLVSFSPQNDFQHSRDINHWQGGPDRLVLQFSSGTGEFTTLVVLRLSKWLALLSNVSRIRRDTYFHMFTRLETLMMEPTITIPWLQNKHKIFNFWSRSDHTTQQLSCIFWHWLIWLLIWWIGLTWKKCWWNQMKSMWNLKMWTKRESPVCRNWKKKNRLFVWNAIEF